MLSPRSAIPLRGGAPAAEAPPLGAEGAAVEQRAPLGSAEGRILEEQDPTGLTSMSGADGPLPDLRAQGLALDRHRNVFCTAYCESTARLQLFSRFCKERAQVQVQRHDEALTVAARETQGLRARLAARDGEFASARNQVQELLGCIAQLKEDLRGLRAKVAQRDGDLASAHGNVQGLRASAAQHEAHLAAARAETQSLRDGELAATLAAAQELRARVAARDGELANARSQVQELRARVAARDGELAKARSQVQRLLGRVGQLKGDIAGAHVEAQRLTGDRDRLRQQLRQEQQLRQDELRRARQEKGTAVAQAVERGRAHCDRVQRKLDASKADAQGLRQRLQQLQQMPPAGLPVAGGPQAAAAAGAVPPLAAPAAAPQPLVAPAAARPAAALPHAVIALCYALWAALLVVLGEVLVFLYVHPTVYDTARQTGDHIRAAPAEVRLILRGAVDFFVGLGVTWLCQLVHRITVLPDRVYRWVERANG